MYAVERALVAKLNIIANLGRTGGKSLTLSNLQVLDFEVKNSC